MRAAIVASSAAILGVSMGLAACAPTDQMVGGSQGELQSERQCFFGDQVRNFRSGDTQVVYVRSLRDEVFELRSTGYCRDLEVANTIVISADVGGTSRLCTGDNGRIAISGSEGGGGGSVCRVRVIKQLTEPEIAALPGRQRP